MKAYKLFRLRGDGSLGPLFINRKQRIKIGESYPMEDHPTKGFAHRPGWHCTNQPVAPHLKMNLKSGEKRVWAEVEIPATSTPHPRPPSQGGMWYLAPSLTVTELI
jgi:hypothetical protein